jgi:rubrerythrin
MRLPVSWRMRTRTSLFGPRLNYYGTWWTCSSCGFRFLKQKHEEKVCDLCKGEASFSHLVLLNLKRR